MAAFRRRAGAVKKEAGRRPDSQERRIRRAAAGQFDESKHDRADDGKFTSGGGSPGTTKSAPAGDGGEKRNGGVKYDASDKDMKRIMNDKNVKGGMDALSGIADKYGISARPGTYKNNFKLTVGSGDGDGIVAGTARIIPYEGNWNVNFPTPYHGLAVMDDEVDYADLPGYIEGIAKKFSGVARSAIDNVGVKDPAMRRRISGDIRWVRALHGLDEVSAGGMDEFGDTHEFDPVKDLGAGIKSVDDKKMVVALPKLGGKSAISIRKLSNGNMQVRTYGKDGKFKASSGRISDEFSLREISSMVRSGAAGHGRTAAARLDFRIRRAARARAAAGQFDESKHKRADDGKFTSGGGSGGSPAATQSGGGGRSRNTGAANIHGVNENSHVKSIEGALKKVGGMHESIQNDHIALLDDMEEAREKYQGLPRGSAERKSAEAHYKAIETAASHVKDAADKLQGEFDELARIHKRAVRSRPPDMEVLRSPQKPEPAKAAPDPAVKATKAWNRARTIAANKEAEAGDADKAFDIAVQKYYDDPATKGTDESHKALNDAEREKIRARRSFNRAKENERKLYEEYRQLNEGGNALQAVLGRRKWGAVAASLRKRDALARMGRRAGIASFKAYRALSPEVRENSTGWAGGRDSTSGTERIHFNYGHTPFGVECSPIRSIITVINEGTGRSRNVRMNGPGDLRAKVDGIVRAEAFPNMSAEERRAQRSRRVQRAARFAAAKTQKKNYERMRRAGRFDESKHDRADDGKFTSGGGGGGSPAATHTVSDSKSDDLSTAAAEAVDYKERVSQAAYAADDQLRAKEDKYTAASDSHHTALIKYYNDKTKENLIALNEAIRVRRNTRTALSRARKAHKAAWKEYKEVMLD